MSLSRLGSTVYPGGPSSGVAAGPVARAAPTGSAELRAAFESASDAFLILDAEARVLDANASAARLLREPQRQLAGRHLRDLVPAESRARLVRMLSDLLHDGRTLAPLPLRGADGALRDVEALLVADVGPGRHLLVLREGTTPEGAQQAGEQTLEDMRRRLAESEKLAALGTLVTGVAHEIRTPLTFVANHAFLLQKHLEAAVEDGRMDPSALEEARAYLRETLSGVDRINQLVLELRRFTRRTTATRSRVSLDAAVAGAVELFRATSRHRAGVVARLEGTPLVEMDVSQVQQVVVNLLDNAVDAMPRSGSVVVETRAADGFALLVVHDDGVGIPAELQHRIFEGFYTTKPHGTGLGLSIVRRIVAEHRGRIGLVSEPGKGTTFTVSFPLAPEAARAPPGSG